MNKKQKSRLNRIIAATLTYVIAIIIKKIFIGESYIMDEILFLISYIIIGYDILYSAVRNIIHGKVFDENFLMSLATIGALVIGEYPEAVAVMLFYQVGELFQNVAVHRSRKSISELMDIRPDYANLKTDSGQEKVDPYDVRPGDIIVVKPGEKIPLDGLVIKGEALLDTAALTGEAVPRNVSSGERVLSGCIDINGLLEISVEKEFSESTVSKILDLVENASSKKSNSENFITKFAAVYTPAVVIAAVFIAFIPPIFIAGHPFEDWIYRALTFLVVSCPCALVISVPLSFFGGIGGASRLGILVKGSNYLETLAKTEIAVFDKTGTLTRGEFKVNSINPSDAMNVFCKKEDITDSQEQLLKIAAYAENFSNHPIAESIRRAYTKDIDKSAVGEVKEIAGQGIDINVRGSRILAGNDKLMKQNGILINQAMISGTALYISIDGVYAGNIVISDTIKDDASYTISELKKSGVKRIIMLTGDNHLVAEETAEKLGIDEVYYELLPGDKVDKLEKFIKETSSRGKLIFVGDGINDAPVLARADVGIAMGGLGSDAAIEAADVVIMTDEPSKIVTAIKIARKTLKISNQNIVFAISVKIFVLILGAFGIANMWEAVFADVGVAVIAILNSMRNLNTKNMKIWYNKNDE